MMQLTSLFGLSEQLQKVVATSRRATANEPMMDALLPISGQRYDFLSIIVAEQLVFLSVDKIILLFLSDLFWHGQKS
jgi:hypothetical protein